MFNWEKRKVRKKLMRQGRHLAKRYGKAFYCTKGQIDTTFSKCKLDENYINYAYYAFLEKDELDEFLKKIDEITKKELKEGVDYFLHNMPVRLGRGHFYESGIGIRGAIAAQ